MITVSGVKTADAANALAGTDLQSAPTAGIILIYVSSSQADTNVSISAPPNMAARSIQPQLRANGVPLVSDDIPYVLAVQGGEQIILNVDIVTSATCGYVVIFQEA